MLYAKILMTSAVTKLQTKMPSQRGAEVGTTDLQPGLRSHARCI